MAPSTTKPKRIYKNLRNASDSMWSCFRIAIGPQNIAVSGFHKESRNSYVDVLSHDHTEFGKINFTQSYEPSNNSKGRHVSFAGETLVTCAGNTFEKINCQPERTRFSISGRDEIRCMAARSQEVFFGIWNTSEIDVYDSISGKFSKTVSLNGMHSFDWPEDMAVTTDKIIICTAFKRVLAFTEKEGKFMFEYFNVATPNSNALSVTFSEKFQMVCVLWDSEQICVYSLRYNNCYVFFQVAGVKHIRMTDGGHLYLLHEDGVQCVHVTEVLTYHNAVLTLPYLLSEEELRSWEGHLVTSHKNIPEDRLERLSCLCQMLDLKHHTPFGDGLNVFELIIRDVYMSKLRRPLNHYWINRRNAHSVMDKRQLHPFRDSIRLDEGFGIQGKWHVSDFSLFGNKLAVSCRTGKCQTAFAIYMIENVKGNHIFLPLHEPKIFDEGALGSVRFISFIDATKIATCCNKSITVYDFEKRERKEPVLLDDITCCIAVNRANIFVGFKHKEKIDVFDFDLRLTERVALQGLQDFWPHDLTVTCEKLIVCASDGNSSRVLAFGRKDGCLLTEYVNILGPKYHPQSVTLSTETTDLLVISWMKSTFQEDETDTDDGDESVANDDDGECDINEEGAISLYSLSTGHCVALVNNPGYFSKKISSFRDGKEETIMTINRRREVNMYSKEVFYNIECWKTTMSFLVPFSAWEAVREHFKLTVNECDDSSQPSGNLNYPERRVYGLLTILQEKNYINLENVDAMEEVYNELFNFHLHTLRSPFSAVLYLQDNLADFKPPGYNQSFAKTVLEVGHSPSERKGEDSPDTLALTEHSESATHLIPNNLADFKPPGYNQSFAKTVLEVGHSPSERKGEDSPDTLALTAHSESATHLIPSNHHMCPIEPVLNLPPVSSDLEPFVQFPQFTSNSDIATQENKEATPSFPGLKQSDSLTLNITTQEYEEATTSFAGNYHSPIEPVPKEPSVSSNLGVLLQSLDVTENSDIATQENKEALPSFPGLGQSDSLTSDIITQEYEEATTSFAGNYHSPIEPVSGLLPVISDLERFLQSQQFTENSDIAIQENKEATPSFPEGLGQLEYLISLPNLRKEQTEPLLRKRKLIMDCSSQNPTAPPEFTKRTKVHEDATASTSLRIPTAQKQTNDSSFGTVPNELEKVKSLPTEQTSHVQAPPASEEGFHNNYVCVPRPHPFPSNSIPSDVCEKPSTAEDVFRIMPKTTAFQNQSISECTPHGHVFDQLVVPMEQATSPGTQHGNLPYPTPMEERMNNLFGTGTDTDVHTTTHYTEQGAVESTKENTLRMSHTSFESRLQNVEAFILQNFNHDYLRGGTAPSSQEAQCQSTSQGATTRNISKVPDAWNSLSVYFQSELQAYKGNADDRKRVAVLVMEHLLTREERLTQNTSGKKLKKISEENLHMIKEIVFFLCPLATNQDLDRAMQNEWLNICKAIDGRNRHYRENIKRQENRKLSYTKQ